MKRNALKTRVIGLQEIGFLKGAEFFSEGVCPPRTMERGMDSLPGSMDSNASPKTSKRIQILLKIFYIYLYLRKLTKN
jgi:hypothetical protein